MGCCQGRGLCGWVVGGGPLERLLGLFYLLSCVDLEVDRRELR